MFNILVHQILWKLCNNLWSDIRSEIYFWSMKWTNELISQQCIDNHTEWLSETKGWCRAVSSDYNLHVRPITNLYLIWFTTQYYFLVLFVCHQCWVCPILPVSLFCPFLIDPSVFSYVYFPVNVTGKPYVT